MQVQSHPIDERDTETLGTLQGAPFCIARVAAGGRQHPLVEAGREAEAKECAKGLDWPQCSVGM